MKLNKPEKQKLKRGSLAVGKAGKAIFWRIPGLKKQNKRIQSPIALNCQYRGILTSASAVPPCVES